MVRYRPYVILNAAMTLDGKIATITGDSKISSIADLKRVHKLRASVDAVLIGINTLLTDDPKLTSHGMGKNPIRVIIDSKARIGLSSKVIRSCNTIPTIIAVSKKASKSKLKRLESLGAKVLTCGTDKVDLKKLLAMLKVHGVNKLLVEGGGEINWSMLANVLIDEVMVTVAPKIAGGRKALTLVEGEGYTKMGISSKLKLIRIVRMGDEVLLHYKVRK